MHKIDDEPEPIHFRNPIKQLGWAQVCHALTLDRELSDGAFRLYVLLLKYARQSRRCWPGVERLARDLDKAASTIKAQLAELTERGLITRQRRFGTSSVTWIENLEQLGERPESRTTEQAFEEPENQTTKGRKFGREEQTGKNMQQDDDGSSSEQHTITSLLTDFGVAPVVAQRLARKCTVDQVRGWIACTNRKHRSLHNPAGFLISKLRSGEPPPSEGNDDNECQVTTCQCGHILPRGYLCSNCGRCFDCCECEDPTQ